MAKVKFETNLTKAVAGFSPFVELKADRVVNPGAKAFHFGRCLFKVHHGPRILDQNLIVQTDRNRHISQPIDGRHL